MFSCQPGFDGGEESDAELQMLEPGGGSWAPGGGDSDLQSGASEDSAQHRLTGSCWDRAASLGRRAWSVVSRTAIMVRSEQAKSLCQALKGR